MADKMTPEQKEMFEKLTPLQQKFCTHSLSGMNNTEAYRAAGGKATGDGERSKANQIVTNSNVKLFLDSMKEAAVNDAVMSRHEMLERLSNLSRVNMSDLITWHVATVEKTNKEGEIEEVEQSIWSMKESAMLDPYAMASISEVTAGKDGFKIKQHSPLAAMKQLADLAGYDAPKKSEISGTVASVNISKEEYADIRKKMLEEDDC